MRMCVHVMATLGAVLQVLSTLRQGPSLALVLPDWPGWQAPGIQLSLPSSLRLKAHEMVYTDSGC